MTVMRRRAVDGAGRWTGPGGGRRRAVDGQHSTPALSAWSHGTLTVCVRHCNDRSGSAGARLAWTEYGMDPLRASRRQPLNARCLGVRGLFWVQGGLLAAPEARFPSISQPVGNCAPRTLLLTPNGSPETGDRRICH